jgi:hypothetical protein
MLTMNFESDLLTIVEELVRAMGLTVPKGATTQEACLFFAKAEGRRVTARPRRVHRSAELVATALAPDDKAGVDQIAAECERGDDLTLRLSTEIARPSKNDALLNDWGIQHERRLHL